MTGILAAANLDTPFDVFNLGNSTPVSLLEMIRTIEECLGKKAILRQMPLQPGDVPITYADISKAERILGYRPATGFAEGVAQFVQWYRRTSRAAATA